MPGALYVKDVGKWKAPSGGRVSRCGVRTLARGHPTTTLVHPPRVLTPSRAPPRPLHALVHPLPACLYAECVHPPPRSHAPRPTPRSSATTVLTHPCNRTPSVVQRVGGMTEHKQRTWVQVAVWQYPRSLDGGPTWSDEFYYDGLPPQAGMKLA